MFGYLLILFIAIPVIEISLLIRIGKFIGWGGALGGIFLTALLGAWLAKVQGTQVFKKLQTELKAGQLPHESLLEGLIIFIAGLVLLTPGFVSDFIGLLCLFPPSRKIILKYLKIALLKKVLSPKFSNSKNYNSPSGGNPQEVKSTWRVDS